MSYSLKDIAQQLKKSDKKVQLIYAFNGVGKTRLSREFKALVSPKSEEESEEVGKVLYYNAYTEDLFFWDNIESRKMFIRPNLYTRWVLEDEGQVPNIVSRFQNYTNHRLTPEFSSDYSEVIFSLKGGDDQSIDNIKISKGEESNFIWSIFYVLMYQVIEIKDIPDPSDRETDKFDTLEYVFIDDPVSSLDDNHLIDLAVELAMLIKRSASSLKFIITTHNPLFYNVLHNEFRNDDKKLSYNHRRDFEKYRLELLEDRTLSWKVQSNDAPFSYHLYLIALLEKSIDSGDVHKYHFNLVRNILEKTSTFLGYKSWGELIPDIADGDREGTIRRILNISSHSKHSGDEPYSLSHSDKLVLERVVKSLTSSSFQFNTKPFH